MESPAAINLATPLLIHLPKLLRKGSKFALSIIWQVEVFETGLKAGFLTQLVEVKARGKISKTELRMECSQRNCEWANSVKLDSTKYWVVNDSSSLALSSHNHSLEEIPVEHLGEATAYLDGIRVEKAKQLEEFRDELESSSDIEMSAGAGKIGKVKKVSGISIVSNDSEVESDQESAASIKDKKTKCALKPVTKSTAAKKSKASTSQKQKSATVKSTLAKPVYEKRIYDSNLPALLDELLPKLVEYADAFAELGICTEEDLNHLITDFSEKDVGEIKDELCKVKDCRPLSVMMSIKFRNAVLEGREIVGKENQEVES